jgi:Phosphoesterase family
VPLAWASEQARELAVSLAAYGYRDVRGAAEAGKLMWSGQLACRHGRLFRDIDEGTVPPYAFMEPDHGYGRGEGNSHHSGNTIRGESFEAGEALMARIYNALVAIPGCSPRPCSSSRTTSTAASSTTRPPDRSLLRTTSRKKTGFDFSLSGVRVPAVAISLLIPAGTVDQTFYEHSTIPATVGRLFTPDPSCHEVIETGVLRPGSAADRVVADVVVDFTWEGRAPDPAAVEFGNGPR